MQRGECLCYLNGAPLRDVPVEVSHGAFLVVFKSDGSRAATTGLTVHATALCGLVCMLLWACCGV